MLSLLQDVEAGIRLDERMRGSVSGTETLPEQSALLESIHRRGKLIFIFGSISHSRERSSDLRRGQDAAFSLLRQSKFPRC